VYTDTPPIRIARIITRLGVGGVERHVSSLTANLDREKYRNWLICGRAEQHERECLEFATDVGIEPIVVKYLRRQLGLWDIRASISLHRILGKLQPQIVETHQSKAGALGRTMARLRIGPNGRKARLIHVFHGHQFHDYFSDSVTRRFIAIERQLARLTDMIITVTPTVRAELIDKYHIAAADKIRVIPIGLDFTWVSELRSRRGWLRARLGASDSTIIFGTVGRLTGIKNTALLVRALARMQRERPRDVRLVIFGDGELLTALQALARELLVGHLVFFAGWMLDRAKVFCDLNVTCLASYNEGSPLCLIESIAAGIPVIATRVGGVPDVVTSGIDGELVESENEEEYARAMTRAADRATHVSPERAAEIRQHYSISSLVKNYDNIYSEVLDRSMEFNQRGKTRRYAFGHTYTE
jgi:glycosyltransferase involved in cell wall biosynthesis